MGSIGIGVSIHPETVQDASRHGFSLGQRSPVQVPLAQVSPIVQMSPSSQAPPSFEGSTMSQLLGAPPGSHEAVLQASPKLEQSGGPPPPHDPAVQVSPTVQTSESSHGPVRGVIVSQFPMMPPGSQEASLH